MRDNDNTTTGIIREVSEALTEGYHDVDCDGCGIEGLTLYEYIGDLLCKECGDEAWEDDDNDDLMEAE